MCFHHSLRDIEEAVAFSLLLFAGKANLTGPWEHRDEDSTLPLPAPTWLHCTTPIDSGLALFIPLPHTQLYNSFSARSRRTSHRPHADCSFRLAIFEFTRSPHFNHKRNIGRPPSCHSHTCCVSDGGQGGHICLSRMTLWERVEDFAESNTCNECVR